MKTKTHGIAALLAVSTTAGFAGADVITSWSFEGLASNLSVTGANSGNFASDGGAISGNANGLHAASSTVTSSPVGNGSLRSLSSNNWAIGDYWQFSSSSVGYSGITIQWDQTGSNTGPRDFNLFYSLNGTTFTQIGAMLTVLANGGAPNASWNGTTASSAYTFGPIAAPAALDNQATIYFRLVDASTVSTTGGSVGTGGTDRVDNVIISGSVPTPGAISLVGLGGLFVARRRRSGGSF